MLHEKLKILQQKFEKLQEDTSKMEIKSKEPDYCLVDENQ